MHVPFPCALAEPTNALAQRRRPFAVRAFLLPLVAALLVLLPSFAAAAQIYRYSYTGNPFGSGNPGFYRGLYTAEHFIFAEITTPTPLVAGTHNQIDTPGLGFLMGDGDHTLVYEETFAPYYELLPQEIIDFGTAEPSEEFFNFYPDFPYQLVRSPITYIGQIFIDRLDESGLPAEWYIQLEVHEQMDFRTSSGASITSTNRAGNAEDVDVTDRGNTFDGWGHEHGSIYANPGSWRLTVSEVIEVPEPPAIALLLLAVGAMIGVGGANGRVARALHRRRPESRPKQPGFWPGR